MDDILYGLQKVLLENASKKIDQELYDDLVKAILGITNCRVCALWTINNNSTKDEVFQSASLIARAVEKGWEYGYKNDIDFVLGELNGTSYILKTIKCTESYYIGPQSYHMNQDCLIKLNINSCIGIPIPEFKNIENDDFKKIIAVLQLFYEADDPKIPQIELFTTTISKYISSLLYQHMLLKKQELMNELIKNYEENGQKRNLSDIFSSILNITLRKYCDYEGASIFIWDSYMNHCRNLEVHHPSKPLCHRLRETATTLEAMCRQKAYICGTLHNR